jgi:flagellar hook-basal body complex protein FliE
VRVEPLSPDVPASPALAAVPDSSAFARALDATGAVLQSAQAAEDAFAGGSGTLQQAIYERARADVALAVATTAATRCAQAVQSVLNMQV